MGNYEYLTEWFQNEDNWKKVLVCFEDMADAQKTLLAERDAAIEDLRGACWACANAREWEGKIDPADNMYKWKSFDILGVG